MAEFNQSATEVERARAYLRDVRTGHVSFADESAPFLTLTRHLAALLDVVDGTEDARAVRMAASAVLAELPDAGLLRYDGEAEQSPSFWIARLQEAVRELLGSTAARLAALEEAERDALRQALTDAVGVRAAAAAQPCRDCVVHPRCCARVMRGSWTGCRPTGCSLRTSALSWARPEPPDDEWGAGQGRSNSPARAPSRKHAHSWGV